MALEQVTIRPYEPGDREQFLALYETVWGRSKGGAWFRWRFEDNPYREGVQMVVAETGGELVGVEPLLPCRLRVDSTTLDAYQPVDWLVHPDYRRQGIFSRMTDALLERYGGDASVLFNFPNDALLPGLRNYGWREVGDVPSRYRIHDPGRVVEQRAGFDASVPVSATLSVSRALLRRLQRLSDRVAARSTDVSVERHDGAPVALLSEVYASNVPPQIHVARDDAFLRWRFANPRWETTTYLAARDDAPVASIVAATERLPASTCTHLLDVQPMTGRDDRSDALGALLAAVVADHRHVDLLRAPGGVHSRLLRRFWFWDDTAGPLSPVTTTSRLAVRPLASNLGDRTAADGATSAGPADDRGAAAAEDRDAVAADAQDAAAAEDRDAAAADGRGAFAGDAQDAPGDDPWRIAGRDATNPENWLLMPADLDIE